MAAVASMYGGAVPSSFTRGVPPGSMMPGQMPRGPMPVPSSPMAMRSQAFPAGSMTMPRQPVSQPPPPPSVAYVPFESGAWRPRVTYRVLDEDEQQEVEEFGNQLPDGKEELIRFCQKQDDEIQNLKMQAAELRSHHHNIHDEWFKRIENLEAHVLSSKLHPVKHGKDAAGPEPEPPQDLPPNGLLQEFYDRTIGEEVLGDISPQEQFEMEEQMQLDKESQMLGLPSIHQLGLPEGSKIIDIRRVEGWYLKHFLRKQHAQMAKAQMENMEMEEMYGGAMMPGGMPGGPGMPGPGGMPPGMRPPPPTLYGRIHDGNHVMTPSPMHPVGPVRQMGLLPNLYPIDFAPVDYENVLTSQYPGVVHQWYKTSADYYQNKKFNPGLFPEAHWERDVDRGRNFRNVVWRTTPSGSEDMAVAGVDVSGDGFVDVNVVGKDLNHDGIPDVLQVNPAVRLAQNVCSKIFPA